MTGGTKVHGYLRVSTDEQAGYSAKVTMTGRPGGGPSLVVQ